jgi:nicotinamide riboside kinase
VKISTEPNGANNKSTIDPVTLAVIKADEVFAKAFCKTLIIKRPGIKKEIYEIPLMPADLSIAIENTTTNNNVVTIGAVIV